MFHGLSVVQKKEAVVLSSVGWTVVLGGEMGRWGNRACLGRIWGRSCEILRFLNFLVHHMGDILGYGNYIQTSALLKL